MYPEVSKFAAVFFVVFFDPVVCTLKYALQNEELVMTLERVARRIIFRCLWERKVLVCPMSYRFQRKMPFTFVRHG